MRKISMLSALALACLAGCEGKTASKTECCVEACPCVAPDCTCPKHAEVIQKTVTVEKVQ